MTISSSAETAAPPLGAVVLDDDRASFSVWAPAAQRVAVEIGDRRVELTPTSGGMHFATTSARPGECYRYVLDDNSVLPDPCSRAQPRGARGPSALVDLRSLAASITPWQRPDLVDLVLYELHIGTFTDEGTFAAAVEHLPKLRELGVRAVEIMPIGTFPGSRGWGYDVLYPYAPHLAYGTPGDFAAFVDAAHRADLGVILDVVYNHLAAGSEQITAFGPYLLDPGTTEWGSGLDYSQPAVREWALQNAEQWVRDFRIDGLRIDAAHAIVDHSTTHVLCELARRVHAIAPRALVISEVPTGDLRPLTTWGHDAQWGDELHHALHVALTGEREGYYADYGAHGALLAALTRPEREHVVVCAQNHDQIGNRAMGDRLAPENLAIASTCVLLSAGIPMLFMGEEYGERRPFQYFTDHDDEAIATATREGRRREFADFTAFSGVEVPDPQALETFMASKLDRSAADKETWHRYQSLLALRARIGDASIEAQRHDGGLVRMRRADIEVEMNFSEHPIGEMAPRQAVIGP